MRRIKSVKKTKSHKKSFFDTKEKLVGAIIVAAVAIILIVAGMFFESSDNQFVINNNTDLKLEYVKAYFVNSEGPINDGFKVDNIESNKSVVKDAGIYNMIYSEANFEMRFKFENYDEILVDAGIFNDTFDGKIAADFEKSDEDNIVLKVKAKNGLLPTRQIDCNEKFMINLSEGFVAE